MGKRRGREEEEVKMYSIFELFKKIYILFVFLGKPGFFFLNVALSIPPAAYYQERK